MRKDETKTKYENFRNNLEILGSRIAYYHRVKIDSNLNGSSKSYEKTVISAESNFLKECHLKNAHNTLKEWRVSRAGLLEYESFKQLIEGLRNDLRSLKRLVTQETWNQNDICRIVDIMKKLKVTSKNTWIVPSSKTLHLLFPKLICPIDKTYSLRFMRQCPEKFTKKPIAIYDYKKNCLERDEIEKEIAEVYIKGMKGFIGKYGAKMKNPNIPKPF